MTRNFDAAGRVVRVNYANGTVVVRVYDAADRPMRIQYVDAGTHAYLKMDYTYSADGLVKRITETDEVTGAAASLVSPLLE